MLTKPSNICWVKTSPFGDALELSEEPPGVGVGASTCCALTDKLAMKTSIITATKTNLWKAIFVYLKEIKVAVRNLLFPGSQTSYL